MKKRTIALFLSFALCFAAVFTALNAYAGTYIVDNGWRLEIPSSASDVYYVDGYQGSYTSLNVPSLVNEKRVVKINNTAFLNENKITNVTIPLTIIEIGESAFYGCTALKQIVIPKSVEKIGDHAFYGCTALGSVTINNDTNLKNIPDHCFNKCSSLITVNIAQGVETIGSYAFNDCTKLSVVTIPVSVTQIADNAFDSCDDLTIYGWNNTYAQEYALSKGIDFYSFGDYKEPEPSDTTDPEESSSITTDPEESSSITTDPEESSSITTDPDESSSITTDPIETQNTNPTSGYTTYYIGDSDLDGRITIKDATLIQKHIAKIKTLNNIQKFLANTDITGDITIKDATNIQKYCAGYLNVLFVGTEVEI